MRSSRCQQSKAAEFPLIRPTRFPQLGTTGGAFFGRRARAWEWSADVAIYHKGRIFRGSQGPGVGPDRRSAGFLRGRCGAAGDRCCVFGGLSRCRRTPARQCCSLRGQPRRRRQRNPRASSRSNAPGDARPDPFVNEVRYCCMDIADNHASNTESQAGRLPHHPFRGLLSVYSRYGLHTRQVPCRTLYTEGFDRFVTSTIAPIATGRNDSCRVGLSPTERPRLSTAHRNPG